MFPGRNSVSFFLGLVLCAGLAVPQASATQRHRVKKQAPAPLPSGPQGPVPQVPLDSIPPVAPTVTYHDGQLMILAPNCTLGDILRLVRKTTGAEMDIPAGATERVVTTLGPGPAQEVISDLLNGSHYNYVLLGSPANSKILTRVVLVPKNGSDNAGPAIAQNVPNQPGVSPPQPQDQLQETGNADAMDADSQPEETAPSDESQEQPSADADQQNAPEPPGIKTPQQLLQEMQERQLQMQRQAAPGQPIPGGQPTPPEQDR